MEKLILEFVVRSALLAACTAAALYLLRVKAARVRHTVWASVVVLMLVLPAWTAWGPKAVLRVLTPAPAVVDAQPVAVQHVASDSNVPALAVRDPGWTWQRSLMALYLLGFGVLIARLITGTVRTRMLVRRAAKRAGRLTSDSCVTPVTVGWLAPSVILPSGWPRWPRAQLNAVLAHEDEHARRRDPLVQWLALLNRAVFWFHPLAWWLERRLSGLAEEACDDAVLVRGHDPLEYSEYLLGLARVVQESGSRVAVVGMAMPGTYLPARIRRIAGGAQVQKISRGRLVSVVAACAAVSTIFTAGAIGYSGQEVHAGSSAAVAAAPAAAASAGDGQLIIRNSGPDAKAAKKARVLLAQATSVSPAPVAAASAAADPSLSGAVTDPSGALVANAPVMITNGGTGATLSTKSNNVGKFQFQNIDAGTYNLSVRVPGFKGLTQTGINVAPGEAFNAGTMALQVGAIAESVTVTGSRSAPVAATAPVANSIGPPTYIAPGPPAHVGMSLDQPAPDVRAANSNYRAVTGRAPDQTGSNGPLRIGGMVEAAKLLNSVHPVYPPDLRQTGVQGTVKFEAVISKEGLAQNLNVISSPDPGLTQAALDAVKQWKYQPSMLNGEPIEVLTTIDVNFSLTN